MDKIKFSEARESILRSGYLLENRIDSILKKRGYYVESNYIYPDNHTLKSRELDIYAMKGFHSGPNKYEFIFEIPIIECINNPQPVAFFTKDSQIQGLHYLEMKYAGIPAKIPEGSAKNSWISLLDYLEVDKYSHYCRGKISNQYCSFTMKKNPVEWMAFHEDDHFDAFKKLMNVTGYVVDKQFNSWGPGGKEEINLEFYFPILILQGDILEVRLKGNKLLMRNSQQINYRCSEIVKNEQVLFQIDVVTEKYFPYLLTKIESEMMKMSTTMKKKYNALKNAMNRIALRAKRTKKKDSIRAILEF